MDKSKVALLKKLLIPTEGRVLDGNMFKALINQGIFRFLLRLYKEIPFYLIYAQILMGAMTKVIMLVSRRQKIRCLLRSLDTAW